MATLAQDGATTRLTVTVCNLPYKPRPGIHYFVYLPERINFWENHPFTITNWQLREPLSGFDTKQKMELIFLISQRAGMTRSLAHKISTGSGTANLKALVEGPYGQHFQIHRYEKVFLIAGGSGITNVVAYFSYLGKLSQTANSRLTTRYIEMAWIAKDHDFVDDILRKEITDIIKTADSAVQVQITIYLSRSSLLKSCLNEAKAAQNSDLSSYKIRYCRPTMHSILHQCIGEGGNGDAGSSDPTALLLCGPSPMRDDMRKALADGYDHLDNLRAGNVKYFEAEFSW